MATIIVRTNPDKTNDGRWPYSPKCGRRYVDPAHQHLIKAGILVGGAMLGARALNGKGLL